MYEEIVAKYLEYQLPPIISRVGMSALPPPCNAEPTLKLQLAYNSHLML